MKQFKQSITIALLMSIIVFSACKTQKQMTTETKQKVELNTKQDTFSYVLGLDIAKFFSQNDFELNMDAFFQGFSDKYKGDSTLFNDEEAKQLMMEFQKELQALQEKKMQEEIKKNKEAGEVFLAENKTKEGVKETASGLQYKVLVEGSGEKPKSTDKVKVHYEGKLINGTIFDSSFQRAEPAVFGVNQVIPGWTEGLQLMSVGSTYEFFIPTNLSYGDKAAGQIPPGSCLIFKVELLGIEK